MIKKIFVKELNLSVQNPNVNIEKDAIYKTKEEFNQLPLNGWLVILKNICITNCSRTEKIVLRFSLQLGLKDAKSGSQYFTIRDYFWPEHTTYP
ncbi:MAG: hypothetical protein V3V45_03220, partial [Candidatus Brocadiales bacterium]